MRKIITTHVLTARKVRSNLTSCEKEVRLVLAKLTQAHACLFFPNIPTSLAY